MIRIGSSAWHMWTVACVVLMSCVLGSPYGLIDDISGPCPWWNFLIVWFVNECHGQMGHR